MILVRKNHRHWPSNVPRRTALRAIKSNRVSGSKNRETDVVASARAFSSTVYEANSPGLMFESAAVCLCQLTFHKYSTS